MVLVSGHHRTQDAPMLKLHGFQMSPNTRRALFALEEHGAPYELVNVDLMAGEQKSPAYLALNPTGRVPTLVDGDFVLWESNAILEYLAARYPDKTLGAQSARETGEMARWMYMNAAHLSPNVARIFAHTIRLPEAQRIARIADEARAEVDRSLAALEGRLAEREHLVDRFSLAEIAIAPTLSAAPMLGIDLTRFPSVQAWLQRILARPAWQKVQR
jgi:glutathione S-transferase